MATELIVLVLNIVCITTLIHGQSTSTLSYEVGDTAIFTCDRSGAFSLPSWVGPPNFLSTYTNQGDSTINPSFTRVSYATDQKTLQLRDVVETDAGDYKCSYAGFGDHTITLSITPKSGGGGGGLSTGAIVGIVIAAFVVILHQRHHCSLL